MQKIYAHRGASGYAPENTLEAFELAAKMGADGVELDVHMTRDGELVVAHDEEVGRVANGFGLICNMTLPELKKLRFNKTHPEYESAAIPTLREVYELLLYNEADKAHAKGMQVNVWTVNEEADIRKSLEAGADMLIGDYPDRMVKIRSEMLSR